MAFALVLFQTGNAFTWSKPLAGGNARYHRYGQSHVVGRSTRASQSPQPMLGHTQAPTGVAPWLRCISFAALVCGSVSRFCTRRATRTVVTRRAVVQMSGHMFKQEEMSWTNSNDPHAAQEFRNVQEPSPTAMVTPGAPQHFAPSLSQTLAHVQANACFGTSTEGRNSPAVPRTMRRATAARFVGGSRRSQSHRACSGRASFVGAKAFRRHVGAELLHPTMEYNLGSPSFDASRTRMKIQLGLRSSSTPRSDRGPDTFADIASGSPSTHRIDCGLELPSRRMGTNT